MISAGNTGIGLAMVAAVKGYKYKPKMESGQAVERTGVELVLAFKLDQ